MPRPKTKSELLQQTKLDFADLMGTINSLSVEQCTCEFVIEHRDRNVRDVLGHLLQWQTMFFGWRSSGIRNQKPEMPAPGFTWQTTAALNQEIWKTFQDSAFGKVHGDLKKSHAKLLRLIRQYDERELFEKRYFAWTGSTSLASYITSAGPSHYRWATKLIKKAVRPPASKGRN